MADTPQEIVNRELREFKRYTGDGLPGEPVNAPLPVGDPDTGVWNPKKKNLRRAMKSTLEGAGAEVDRAREEADKAEQEADRAESAANTASAAWDASDPNRVATVASISALSTLPTGILPNGIIVFVPGYHASSPGIGGGRFFWDAASAETADGGRVFEAADTASGRWKRIIEGPLCATDYGAVPEDEVTGTDAVSRMPPSKYVLRHTIHASSFTWLGNYTLDTLPGVELVVGGGTGTFILGGDGASVGYAKVRGFMQFGGPNFDNRSRNNRIGDLDIIAEGGGVYGLILRPSYGLQISGLVHVHCNDPEGVGHGVYFNTLKRPTLGDFLVTGYVSLGYGFAGNSTVAEYNIEDGYIRSLTTDQDPSYEHSTSGDHGIYLKGCLRTTVESMVVYADQYLGSNYHIKLRDNTDCVFNQVLTRGSDRVTRGTIQITSDANTLIGVVNSGNIYRNVDGIVNCHQTGSGFNGNNRIENFIGGWTSTQLGLGPNIFSGDINLVDSTGNIGIRGVEFENARVKVPSMDISTPAAQFVHDVIARQSTFLQTLNVGSSGTQSRGISLRNCIVLAGENTSGSVIQTSSGGSCVFDIMNSNIAGDFRVDNSGGRTSVGNLKNSSFGGVEVSGSGNQPTTKNYKFVTFSNAVYTN